MKTIETIKKLNSISAYQKGLFTSAQAKRLGVERYVLSRLEKDGSIERVVRGVYRMGGAPSLREEEVIAVWLSLDPGREPGTPTDAARVPVATGATSAWLQQLGEIGPTPMEFCTVERKQTQRDGLTVRKRAIGSEDIVYASGILATSPARTVLDLIDCGEDLSLVASVLRDALERGLVADVGKLAEEVDLRGRKAGIPKGESLYRLLAEGE
ncbi:type IV toxin-antitoxin system AbiEi family antitoxin domain-containing protein [Gordonibacter sp. 28C]|uniref:type IV toxin-antitoxin system AbiEi family antitoxin domain-containing protein n=1 Tax=Gordonibacter sp. 28C TaxID=2078569 RepID=UPI0013147ED6|nr:type IV toxin-antitoxin system AbiEi family antitoxin domain-containing protein [Gordonibacter sp. 28C]